MKVSRPMLDIKYVREHLDEVAETMKNRHASFDPEQFTALDVQRREVIAEEEALQAERNKLSKEIGALMGQGKTDEANATKSLHDSNHEFLYCFFQSVQSQFSGLPPQLLSFS